MVQTAAASQPLEPDPRASMPQAEWRLVQGQGSMRPLAPGTRATQATATFLGGRKPLRPPKVPAPRARSVDTSQVVHPATVPSARVIALRPPTMPPGRPAPVPGAAAGATVTSTSFDGGKDNDSSIPPDTQAAFGPNHIFNPLNNDIQIYTTNGNFVSQQSLNAFWTNVGITGHTFDPKAVYDHLTERFYFVSMADAEAATSRLLIAVSDTSDPTGIWRPFAVQVDPNEQGQVWMDYPSLGYSADKITVQVNLYSLNGNVFSGSTVYVFDKASFLNPQVIQKSMSFFMLPNQGASQVPALTIDAGVNDHYLVSCWTGNAGGVGYLAIWRVTGTPANNTTAITRIGYVPSSNTWDSIPPNGADFAPQLGIPERLDVGDDRLLSVVLRNNTLFCCHTVMLPIGGANRSAIQWWQITVGTWAPTLGLLDGGEGTFFAFPTLAVNNQGDLLIGHGQFSSQIHPSGSFVLIPNGGGPHTANIFAPGLSSYLKTFGGPRNRWGDYSSTHIDVQDGRNFWTIQEYADDTSNMWATKIAHIVVV